MRHFLAVTLVLLPLSAVAQDQVQADADRGFLTTLIENNLSGDERVVNIQGFRGALSSQASIVSMTIADSKGVWLTLEDVVLDWNRGALLRGHIDVQQLTAGRIIVARAPVPAANIPTAEATPFALPELPVSIQLDQLAIARIELGDSFLGEDIALTVDGTASLAGGEGSANITAMRLDGKAGEFRIDGSYSNTSHVLGLVLNLTEGPDGIAARLLDVPGRPSVALDVSGNAPLNDFAATLSLDTDGAKRLDGDFGLQSDDAGSQFSLDVGGDISPLLPAEYAAFFGDDVSLVATGTQVTGGGFNLSKLDLSAQKLHLQGAASVDADGWPERLSLTGSVRDTGGDIVLLPLSGPKTYVRNVDLDIAYDRAISDDWTATFDITEFDRPGLLIDDMSLSGGGVITQGDTPATAAVTANLTYAATGLDLDDAGAAAAFGDTISGEIIVDYSDGNPVTLDRFTVNGAGLEMLAEATIAPAADNMLTQATIVLGVDALDRFATITGQPDLSGAAELTILSTISPLDGLFDVLLTGTTTDLTIGIAQLDPLLRGVGDLSLQAVRDTTGTRLDGLRIATTEAEVTANATLTSGASQAEFAVSLRDAARVFPEISGPARLSGDVTRDDAGVIVFDVTADAPAARITASGDVNPAGTGDQTINADLRADISDLSPYAALAGRPLDGAINAQVAAVVLTGDGLRFDADIQATTVNLETGLAQLDTLLAGSGRLSGAVARTGDDSYRVTDLTIATPAVDLRGDVDGSLSGAVTAAVNATLNDAGKLAAGLNGPLRLSLDAMRDVAGVTDVDLTATGSGTDITLDAQIAAPADDSRITADLAASVANLAAFRALTGQPLSGGVTADITGSFLPDLSDFNGRANITTRDIGIGNAQVDQVLRGAGSLVATASRAAGVTTIPQFNVQTPQITASGSLSARDNGTGQAQFQTRLANIGLFTDTLSGPVTASGNATRNAANWQIDVSGDGPGGITLSANGSVADSGSLNLTAAGQVPLGLANDLLDPRRLTGDATFNLSVNGPPALSSVSGRINLVDARLAVPNLAQALENIDGGVTLSGNAATVNITGDVASGGSVSVNGPVTLVSPFNGDLTLRLNQVILQDPNLYHTTANGQIAVNGALTGGAQISGAINLDQTDVQVPSSGIGALGDLPNVAHRGASTPVRLTLDRAGATTTGNTTADTAASGPAFPLDLTINAPNRIFIRGRGLDAELGGALTIGGTSNNVIPVGQFNLLRGRLNILQQRFELTEGSATMQGDFIPFLRLVAETEAATGTQIRVVVEGPANAPEVTFESTPELPQDEVLAQLIFGRNLSEISPLQAVQLAAAVGTLAGRGGGGIIDNFRQNIGLDDFDVTTDVNGNAAVRAGKYLSENVYTDVTINAQGQTEINLNLDITSDITAKGTVDADGETSVGVFFERDY